MIGIVILPVDLRRTRVRSESSLRGCPHRNQRQKSNVCLWRLAARLRRGKWRYSGKDGQGSELSRIGALYFGIWVLSGNTIFAWRLRWFARQHEFVALHR